MLPEWDNPKMLPWAGVLAAAFAVLLAWTVYRYLASKWRRRREPHGAAAPGRDWTWPQRLLLLAAILLVLAQPVAVRQSPSCRSLLYLVDDSASSAAPAERIESFIARQNASQLGPDDQYGVLLCAEGVVNGVPYPTSASVSAQPRWNRSAAGRLDSRVHQGLKDARLTLGHTARGTVVLLSDGHFNREAALREARFFESQGIGLEVVQLPCAGPRDVFIRSLLMPPSVRQGAEVRIRTVIENTGPAAEVDVKLGVDGRVETSAKVLLEKGTTVKNFSLPAVEAGLHVVNVEIEPGDPDSDRIRDNNYRVSALRVIGRSRMLFVEGKPDVSKHVRGALRTAHVTAEVKTPAELAAETVNLDEFDVVGLVNVPAGDLPQPVVEKLEKYVRGGGGLVVYGGDRSFDCGDYRDSVFERRLLPVRSAQQHPGNEKAVGIFILLIDVSGSMSGGPLQMAKEVGIATLEKVKPGMAASVLSFDAGAFVVSRPEVVNPTTIRTMIANVNSLSAQGGTDIVPCMKEAGKALSQARQRPGFQNLAAHLIIISDGEAVRQAELQQEARRLKSKPNRCTVHTVLIGSSPSSGAQMLMKAVATAGGGRAERYQGKHAPVFQLTDKEVEEENARLDFSHDARDVMFLADLDTELHLPEQGESRRLLDSVVWDYNRITDLKQSASLSLSVDDSIRPAAAKDAVKAPKPVYAWHYLGDAAGGRVAACTIDVDGIWSRGLLESPLKDLLLGDPLFFCQRLKQGSLLAASLKYDAYQSDEVIVTLWGQIPKGAIVDLVPRARGESPLAAERIPLFRNTPATYQGRFPNTGDRHIYQFDVEQRMPGGKWLQLGNVLAVLNPKDRTAEQVGPEPDEQTLAALAAEFGNEVKRLQDTIAVGRPGIQISRDRLWNEFFTWALISLLLAGSLVRLESPRRARWCWAVLVLAVVAFAGGVFYVCLVVA